MSKYYGPAKRASENAERAALEPIRKDADDPTLSVGDMVFHGGAYAAVTDIQVWEPGQHGSSPIRNDWTAVQIVTDMGGSRWHGREPQAAQSGYTACACRDCMDTAVSGDTTKPELCTECTDAGCESFPRDAWFARIMSVLSYECQRDDAYDAAAEEEGCTCDYLRAQYDPTYRQCAFCASLSA